MKYFYSIVIDGYPYAKVTEERFKNEIDFIHHIFPDEFEELGDHDGSNNIPDVWDFLEVINLYPTGDSYIALDENNQCLKDLEGNQETFANICKEYGRVMVSTQSSDDEYELYKKLKDKYEK